MVADVPGDSRGWAQTRSDEFKDERLSYYWDGGKVTGEEWAKTLGGRNPSGRERHLSPHSGCINWVGLPKLRTWTRKNSRTKSRNCSPPSNSGSLLEDCAKSVGPVAYESSAGINCERLFAGLSILFGSPFELLRLSSGALIPGSIGAGVRCGTHTVSAILPRSDTDLSGGRLLLHLPTAKRRLPIGNRLRTAEKTKVASRLFMDRHGVGLGAAGFGNRLLPEWADTGFLVG